MSDLPPYDLDSTTLDPCCESIDDLLPPPYLCTVKRSGLLGRKIESTSTDAGNITYPFRRPWHTVSCRVKGTKLEFVRDSSLQVYSLHGATCGIASDYRKRRNVLRIIVERDQFLLLCNGARDCVEWLECIQKAINISPPLELRKEPVFQSRRGRVGARTQGFEVFEAHAGPLGELTVRSRRREPVTLAEAAYEMVRIRSRPQVRAQAPRAQVPRQEGKARGRKPDVFVCAVLNMNHPRTKFRVAPRIPLSA